MRSRIDRTQCAPACPGGPSGADSRWLVAAGILQGELPAMNGEPTETEIKLLVGSDGWADIEHHPAFATAHPAARRERTIYFDTEDLALRERGFSLRLRRSDDGWVQTLKHASEASAVVGQRNEWEWPVASEALDTGALDALASRSGELDGAYVRARPQFVTDIRRKAWQLLLEGGTKVEAVLDRGTVKAGTAREDVSELELEIKDGPLGPALRLALDLAKRNSLRLGAESKAERGYRLVSGKSAAAEKSHATHLTRHASLKDAFAAAVGTALSQFVANVPAAEAGEAEAIHQMRIALRRLRTAFVLFAPHLDTKAKKRFNAAIRRLGKPLGTTRDWDVFVLETLPHAVKDGVSEALLAHLAGAAQARRAKAHAAIRQLIEGTQPTRLILEIETWVTEGTWRSGDGVAATVPIGDAIPGLMDRMLHRVKKRAHGLARHSIEALHPLRKSVKKLRYSADDAAGLFKRKRVEAYIERCKKMQTLLGDINDAATTARLVARLGGRKSSPGARALLAWNRRRCEDARKELGPTWRKLRSARPFWR